MWLTSCRQFRGPVTNLTSLEGYIILTIGNRLETHQWTGSNLMQTAFFDAPILISSLNVVKTFILFGDVHKGIYFVQYRDRLAANANQICCQQQKLCLCASVSQHVGVLITICPVAGRHVIGLTSNLHADF